MEQDGIDGLVTTNMTVCEAGISKDGMVTLALHCHYSGVALIFGRPDTLPTSRRLSYTGE